MTPEDILAQQAATADELILGITNAGLYVSSLVSSIDGALNAAISSSSLDRAYYQSVGAGAAPDALLAPMEVAQIDLPEPLGFKSQDLLDAPLPSVGGAGFVAYAGNNAGSQSIDAGSVNAAGGAGGGSLNVNDGAVNVALPSISDGVSHHKFTRVGLPILSASFSGDKPGVDDLVGALDREYSAATLGTWLGVTAGADKTLQDVLPGFGSVDAPGFVEIETALSARLQTLLEGKAMPERVESALYVRARHGDEDAYEAIVSQAAQAADSGGTLPTLTLEAQRLQARMGLIPAHANQAMEVAKRRYGAEIKYCGLALAVTQSHSATVQGLLLGGARLGLAVHRQALRVAGAVVDEMNALFALAVALYDQNVEIYQAEAQVYESALRGALANLERQKIIRSGERLVAEIEATQVALADAALAHAKAEADQYSADVEAAYLRVSAGRVSLAQIAAQIKSARVLLTNQANLAAQNKNRASAGRLRYESAALDHEQYLLSVQRDASLVEDAVLNAEISAYNDRSQVDMFSGLVESARVRVRQEIEARGIESEYRDLAVDRMAAGTRRYAQLSAARLARAKAKGAATAAALQGDVQQRIARIESLLSQMRRVREVGSSAAGAYGRAASAALGAVNGFSVQREQV